MNLNEYIADREARDPEYQAAREELRPEHDIRRALIAARIAAGLTQEELAERIGLKQTAIARLERGLTNPRLDTLFRLAEGLNVRFEISPHAPLHFHGPFRRKRNHPTSRKTDGAKNPQSRSR